MSRVTWAQTSFNAGMVSERLRARIDQSLYGIAVDRMVGFAPLVEGPAEAMPGLLMVAQARGPCRLLRFEYNTTQGHVVEASAGVWRIFTNDARIDSAPGVPVEVASPYNWAELQELTVWQSYDALYCYHPAKQTRKFVRLGATSFAFELHEYKNGPFEPRNKEESLTVSSSALSGTVTLTASSALFEAGDVGGLFQMEARDFGDTPAWEPGVTVSAGALRTSLERVYRAATSGRTGTWQPSHTEGLEWDGSKEGTDINSNPAGGVQWEYLHDRIGIVKITGYTNATTVTGTVERRLPFSSVSGVGGTGNYDYTGGYYDEGWTVWTPPAEAVTYQYGTWRWRFGAFSDRRGWPQCGAIWRGRHCVAKDNYIYASVAGDLEDHATFNELGEISADMAIVDATDEPNPILAVVPDDQLLLTTAGGTFALSADNLGAAFGPKNYRLRKQNDAGAGSAAPVSLDGRTLYIDRSGGRIYEADFDPQRNIETPLDLTRYARRLARPGVRMVRLASQRLPHNHLWAVREDGTLACACYLPEEEVLGWTERPLGQGLAARDLCHITDPAGRFDQVWVAVQRGDEWFVTRMAPWREDGESDESAPIVDLAYTYDGTPTASHAAPWLAGATVDIVADGAFYLARELDENGAITLPQPAARVAMGLRFDAYIEGLPVEAGGDNGPTKGKMARISRAWIDVLQSRGLAFGVPGDLVPLEQLADGSEMDAGFAAYTGLLFRDAVGDNVREAKLRIERVAPAQVTLRAWGGMVEVQQK